MDVMVTGRMAPQKKELGNRALEELGTNASQAINALYDYVIAHRRLPFESPESPAPADTRQSRLEEAAARVDAIPKVTLDAPYAEMSLKDARAQRTGRL